MAASVMAGSPKTACRPYSRSADMRSPGYRPAPSSFRSAVRDIAGAVFTRAGFVVVTLADGRRRSIRRAATDLGGTAAMAAESGSTLPRVSARTILPLAHHLARTFTSSSKEEVICDDDPCLSPSRSVARR